MRCSVVICTVDRAASLRQTLAALREQTHREFEVVVVAGPSADDTDALLAAEAPAVRVVRHDAVHLSRSRNLGIDAAAGEVIAFIDDDAVPEPAWLERLDAAFAADPQLAGAGGFVRGPNGTSYQYRYSLCSRLGHATTQVNEPDDVHAQPGADPFLYLQGTNAAFRRDVLREAGGFDEEIEFFHDETDLCARLLDRGYRLRVVPDAVVIHRFEPSRMRDPHGRLVDPFPILKNQVYFVHRHALAGGRVTPPEAQRELDRFAEMWRDQARELFTRRIVDANRRDHLLQRVDAGLTAGVQAGRRGTRLTRPVAAVDEAAFAPYPTTSREHERRRRIVFVSSEYPPGDFGGIGRFSQDLAGGFASHGWEAHVIVPGEAPRADPLLVDHPQAAAASARMTRVEFDEGAWIHRVPSRGLAARLAGSAVRPPLERAALAYHALRELEARFGPADVVSAPLWGADGLVIALDPQRPTVTTLMTSLRTVVKLHPSWPAMDVGRLLTLESETLRQSSHLHAISAAILDGLRADYPMQTAGVDADVLHLGIRDRRAGYRRNRPDGDARVRILFVGRLERRKGVDTLLEAAANILSRHSGAELVLVGKDTENTELGQTYRGAFRAAHADRPDLLGRVTFAGMVDEDELYGHYADADIFAAPSRYESFGLVHVEAQMMGLPVVACAVGGINEVVADGITGRLVTPEDAEGLTAVLDDLIANPETRVRMGRAARERYEARFTNELAVSRTASWYDGIARDHSPRAVGPDAISRPLAGSIELAAGVAANVARQVADDLIDPDGEKPLAVVRRVWHAPDDVFVGELYRGILGREPDAEGLAQFVTQLKHGRDRGDVVREIGWSQEFRERGNDTDWLGDLFSLDGWIEERACAVAFAQPTDERFAQDIGDLLISDPQSRSIARDRVHRFLASGGGRLAAARDLLSSDLPLRSAPDFAGWEPMLVHLAQAGSAGPNPALRDRLQRRVGPAIVRARTRASQVRRLPRRVAASVRVIETMHTMVADTAAAVGRAEAQLRAAEAQLRVLDARSVEVSELVSQGHESAGRLLNEIWGRIDFSTERVEGHMTRVNEAVVIDGLRTDILQRKLGALAIVLRDRLPVAPESNELPEPVITEAGAERLSAAGDDLRVNLGAGEKPLERYLNVDARPLEGIDVVADVRRLPFAEGSLAEIVSAHLIEHFRAHQLEVALLPYWRSLLRDDGILRVICPNWEAMTARLADGRLDWEEFKVLTFGLQDYEGDDHFAMYTPDSLISVLESAGFRDIQVVAEDRMDGICPEMELTARPEIAASAASRAASEPDQATDMR